MANFKRSDGADDNHGDDSNGGTLQKDVGFQIRRGSRVQIKGIIEDLRPVTPNAEGKVPSLTHR